VLLLAGAIGSSLELNAGKVIAFVSPSLRVQSLMQGVVDTGDLAYMLLFTAAMLFLTLRVVESRRWR
jgi:hypothetical protein